MPSEELDRQLREFLENARTDRTRGYTNEMILQRLTEHAAEDARRFDDLSNQLTSHRRRLEGVEVGLERAERSIQGAEDDIRKLKLERDVDEITGRHDIPPPPKVPSKVPAWVTTLNEGVLGWFVKGAILVAGGGAYALLHALFGGH